MRRRQVIAMKSTATKRFNKGEINAADKKMAHHQSDKFRGEINSFIKCYKFKSRSIKGYVLRRGKGIYFYNNAKDLLEQLTVIIGEMEAGNTSIKMRNMGQSILDALLRSKGINKTQYQKLVKKYFNV